MTPNQAARIVAVNATRCGPGRHDWPRSGSPAIFADTPDQGWLVFDQVMSAVINILLAIPPIRFVMGLVEPRWRPLWAALWIAVIVYLISRTMNQLALRRVRLRLLREPPEGRPLIVPLPPAAADRPDSVPGMTGTPRAYNAVGVGETTTDERSERPAARATTGTPAGPMAIPLPVVAAAVIVGALAVAGVAIATRSTPNEPSEAAVTPLVDSAAPAPSSPIDVRYRSGRMDGDHCVGTFEVTHGTGGRARLVAFVMDSAGAVIGRDSAQVASAVTGVFVDFRFRYVECDEVDDWQIQATTTRPR